MMYFITLIFLVYILCTRKSSYVLKIYCLFYLLADIINPLVFLNNEEMYIRSSWGYTGEFNFEFDSLVDAYEKSYLIIFMIIVFNYLIVHLTKFKNYVINFNTVKSDSYQNYLYLYLYLVLSAFIYIICYELKIGITGVAGDYKYHQSGIIHYYRSYISPVFILILLNKINIVNIKNYIIIFFYAIISGITSSSRFVAITPIVLMAPFFIQNRIIFRILILALTSIICFIVVTVSRDLTFVDSDLNFLNAIIYSILSLNDIDLMYILDTITGRLSGAQQLILASKFSGIESCNNIFLFFLGEPICHDAALNIYKLDLSDTEYGIGFGIISSIIVHDLNWYSYIAPAFFISFFIYISDIISREIIKDKLLSKFYYYYLFLSSIFLFAGPLKFFYFLSFFALLILLSRRYIYNAQ